MSKVLSKLLAMTLSLAMVITGFGWFGAVSVNAATSVDEYTYVACITDADGNPVEGVEVGFYKDGEAITKAGYDANFNYVDKPVTRTSDASGEISITVGAYSSNGIDSSCAGKTIEVKVVSDAYVCDETHTFTLNDSVSIVDVDGTALTFGMAPAAIKVKAAGGEEPVAEKTGLLTVKVVDQNEEPVEGLDLFLEFKGEDATESDNVEFDAATDETGTASVDITEEEVWPAIGEDGEETGDYYLLKAADESVTYNDVKVELGMDTKAYTFYVDTVDGKAYAAPYVFSVNVAEAPAEAVVTFDANGGSVDPASAETVEGKLASLPAATKEGFAFLGWFTAAEGGEKVTAETVFEEDTTIYAHWTDASVWDANDFEYTDYSTTRNASFYQLGNDTSKRFTATFHVVEGLSEVGAAKLAVNKDLVIPAEDPEGKKVQGVGSGAFKGKGLTSVKFPENVVTDNDTGFDDSVTRRGDFVICSSAFSSNNFTEVKLPLGTIVVENLAFQTNASLTKVELPETILSIQQGAFAKCAIEKVVFPEKTDFGSSLATMAFAMNKIKTVKLPKNLLVAHKWVFMQNTGMEEVVGGNANESKGGVVYMYAENNLPNAVACVNNGGSVVQKVIIITKVAFDANGGTTDAESMKTVEGKLESLPAATRTGYKFLGWFTAAEGGEKITTDTVFDEDATVYAHWEEMTPSEKAEEAIGNLPQKDVTVEDEDAVKAAREAYDALSEEEKASLTPGTVEKLEAAEAKVAAAKAEAAQAESQAKVDAVINLANDVVDATAVNKKLYKTAAVEAFESALENAVAVLKNESASTEELKNADADLKAAMDSLKDNVKDANTMTAKAVPKTVKYSKVRRAKQTVKAITVKNAKGTVSYKKVSGSTKLTVNAKTGKITVKKGTKKGTYRASVKVTAAGNGDYKSLTKIVKVTIKVR